MKIVWHIFLKDLRRLAVPVALLVLVFAVKFIVGWRLIVGEEPTREGFERAEWFVNFFRVLELAGSYFLTLRLIGEDSVVATRTFWRTRPVAGGRLLAAKLLGLGLMLGVLPVVISVPWWIGCGLNGGQLLLAALDVLALQVAVVAPALLVAVLTDSLARALLWTLVVGAAAGTWGLIWLLIGPSYGGGRMGSSIIATSVVVTVTVGIVVALQFLARRLGRSMGVALGGTLLAALCSIAWRWDFSGELFPPSVVASGAEEPRIGAPAQLRLGKSTLFKNGRNFGENWGSIHFGLYAEGIPENLRLVKGAGEHRWRWSGEAPRTYPDERRVDYRVYNLERAFGVPERSEDEETQRWWSERRPLYGISPPKLGAGELIVSGETDVSLSMALRLRDAPPEYEFRGWFALAQPRLLLEMPMTAGGWRAVEGNGVRIVATRSSSNDISVVMVEGRFESSMKRWMDVEFSGPFNQFWREAGCFSADRTHGGVGYVNGGTEVIPTVRIGAVTLELQNVGVSAPRVIRDSKWVERWADWRETTTLMLVDFPEVTRFVRSVKVERFEFENRTKLPALDGKP